MSLRTAIKNPHKNNGFMKAIIQNDTFYFNCESV